MRISPSAFLCHTLLGIVIGCSAIACTPEAKEPELHQGRVMVGGNGREAQDRSESITSGILENAQERNDLWVSYGRNYAGWRHSPSDQINRDNVHLLEQKWKFQLHLTVSPGYESTPLVFNNRIYITLPGVEIICADAETGSQIWRYRAVSPPVEGQDRELLDYNLYMSPNRGLGVSEDKLYIGTGDARLICVSAIDGTELWDRRIADHRAGYRITSAPLVVGDKVITGIGGSELGIRGFISAYATETGKKLWQFNVIPEAGNPGNETWSGDSWKHGGGAPWLTGTYDSDLNLVYWGTATAAPDFNPDARLGDNLFTNCILALNPESGELVWYFQATPHDRYDWDGVSEPILVDEMIDGKNRKLIVQANRNGYVYVLDRLDGTLLYAFPFTKVNWADLDESGKPVIKPSLAASHSDYVFPGIVGGTNWPPAAYNPLRRVLYIPEIERSSAVTPFSSPPPYQRGSIHVGGSATFESEPARGSITAVDILAKTILWKTDMEGPNWGGVLSTGGGLVFGGSMNHNLYALDHDSGEILWEFETESGIYAPPISYEIKGRQFIGVASGWGSMGNATSGHPTVPGGRSYYAFGLPD